MNKVLQRTMLAGLALTCTASAAPLFPDVPDSQWAADAVRQLAAHGLLEGYPDGTFKGDRAASRFEVAMLVARVLAKLEQANATFATKEELEAVRKLALALRSELEALGVRVTNLEQNTSILDKRVTELERITFYGALEARITAQSFHNDGAPDNDNQRGGAGAKSNVPYLNYNQIVGANQGAQLRPQVQAVIPVVDYRNGRALVNGVGYTALARLGMKIKIDPDSDAGVEFAAYTSQGNQNIDAYWGVSAPYLANPWTMNQDAAGIPAGQNNQPFTRAVFDHAWYEHKPSKTRVVLGTFDSLRMDRFVYAGQTNNNAYGPARFPGFGIQVQGQVNLGEDQDFLYEVFGTRFGDGGNVYQGRNYFHVVYGGDVAWRHDRGDVKLNWVRYIDETPGLATPLPGLDNITNLAYLNSPGWSQTQWVNPPGYFALQQPISGQAQTSTIPGAFIPNPNDTRPIAGWNQSMDNSVGLTSGAGNFGSQAQNTFGLSNRYWLPLSDHDKERLNFTFEYGHSDYQSNRNSGYSAAGNMGRLEVAAALLEGNLNLSLQALRVDPTYNPALFNASLLGIRFVRPYNFMGRFNLHDSGLYPHNREGFLLKGSYNWDNFTLSARAGLHQQTRTSLYDVRVLGSALGPSIPTNAVIGFAPGFYDVVFSGFAHPNVYGIQSGNSFDANLNPLENPRGSQQEYGLNFHYQIQDNLGLDLGYERNSWLRQSRLTPAQGGSQNQVDLATNYGLAGMTWGFQKDWTARGGLEIVQAVGHHDPGGLYNGYANSSGQINFTNVNSLQTIPYVGMDWQMSKTSSWSVDFRYYTTRDYANVPAGTNAGSVGATSNPFNWSGPQITSYYRMTF